MLQPDFNKIFCDYFSAKPKKVRYELRLPPNFIHDVVFFSSLIHDSTFNRSEIIIKNKSIIIPINRDCWELYVHDKSELLTVKSKLIFAPVSDIEWIFKGDYNKSNNDKLMIDSIFIDLNYRDYDTEINTYYINGETWRLKFNMPKYDFKAQVIDIEIPKKHIKSAT